MVVQHNMSSINGSRQFGITTKKKAKSAERLSSGYKINRAADDAAGLQISEKMRFLVRGLNRASDNAQDGISLLQTADGALDEVHSLVQRMRELAVQGANDTNTDIDREAIQAEIDALAVEIDRIADSTEFNDIKLLNGSLEQTTTANPIQGTSVQGLERWMVGVVTNPVVDGSVSSIGSTELTNLNNNLVNQIVPQAVNSITSAFPVLNSASQNGLISDKIGLKIYEDAGSSTLAYVAMGYGYYGDGTIANDMISLNLSVNISTLSFQNGDLTADSRTALETTIIHEMMHAFMDDVLTNGMIGATNGVMDASNAFPSWFSEGMAQSAAGGCANSNDWVNGGLGLTGSSSLTDISSAVQSGANRLSSGSTSSQYGTGYLACMYLGYLAAGSPSSITSATLAGGLSDILAELMAGNSISNVINEISGGAYTSLSDFETKFGDTDSAQFIQDLLGAVGNTGNGGVVRQLTEDDMLADANSRSNVYQVDDTQESVTSSVGNNRDWGTGGSVNTGSNYTGSSGGTGGGSGTGGSGGAGGTGGTGGTGGSGGTGTVISLGPLNLQIGAKEGQAMSISIEDMHAVKIGISNLSVMSHAEAGNAITACDEALQKVSANRSKIGAFVNRLEHTINNVDNTAENTQAAESKIRDTDMAAEMVEYSKHSILEQVGQSMLAQANQSKQGVLTLLQ